MDPLFIPIAAERQALDEGRRRRQQYATNRQEVRRTPDLALRATDLVQNFPGLSPGLLQASLLHGLPDDVVQQLYDRESSTPEDQSVPLPTQSGNLLSGILGAIGSAAETVAHDFVYEQLVKPTVRTAITGLDAVAQELVQRPLTAGLTSLSTGRSFSEAYDQYGDSAGLNIIQHALGQEDFEGSRGVEDRSLLGSGILPGGLAQTEQEFERTLTLDGKPATLGRAIVHNTLGQFTSNSSTAYEFAAGATQLAVDVLGDPAAWVSGGSTTFARGAAFARGARGSREIRAAIQGSGFLTAVEGGVSGAVRRGRDISRGAEALMDAAGAVTSPRLGITPEGVEGLFRQKGLIDAIAQSNMTDLVRSFTRAPGARLEPRDLRALADMTDHDEIAQFLFDKVSKGEIRGATPFGGYFSGLTGFRNRVQELPLVRQTFAGGRAGNRFGGQAPTGSLQTRDPWDAIEKLDGFMRQARVGEDRIEEVLRTFTDDIGRVGELEGFLGETAGPLLRREVSFDSMYRAYRQATMASIESVLDIAKDPQAAAEFLSSSARSSADRTLFRTLSRVFDKSETRWDSVESFVADQRESIAALTDQFLDEVTEFRLYGADEMGNAIETPWSKVSEVLGPNGSERLVAASPQLTSEMSEAALMLPDVTTFRRAATRTALLRNVYQTKGWDVTTAALQGLTRSVFKPLVLLRPAYIARIGTELTARMQAGGYDNVLTDPGTIFSVVRNHSELATALGDNVDDIADLHNVVVRRQDVLGQSRLRNSQRFVSTRNKPPVGAGQGRRAYATDWRREITLHHNAEESRVMARLMDGDFSDVGDIAQDFSDPVEAWTAWATQTQKGRETIARLSTINESSRGMLTDENLIVEAAQALHARMRALTNSRHNSDILQAIATGRVGEWSLKSVDDWDNVARRLETHIDEFGPPRIKTVEDAGGTMSRSRGMVDKLASWIIEKPETHWARYPVLRQELARTYADMLDTLADDGLRNIIVHGDPTQNLPGALAGLKIDPNSHEGGLLLAALENSKGREGLITTLDDFEHIARSRAAEVTKDLLFDVSTRSARQNAFDVFLPFYDAYFEVTRAWSRTLRDNPGFFSRAIGGYQSARDQGFFYANDRGEEVFTMPGGGALAAFVRRMNEAGNNLVDVPFAAGGALIDAATGNVPDFALRPEFRVQGMNLVANGIGPGFGPVVQWLSGAFLPDTPDFRHLQDVISPFGTRIESVSDLASGRVIEELVPAWARKALQAITTGEYDQTQWNSTVGDIARTLVSTNRYNPGDPADLQRLNDDAESAARWVFLLRSFGQFAAPTGPSVTPMLEVAPKEWDPETDPEGVFFTIGTLANEYWRLVDQVGFSEASSTFVDRYGMQPYYLTQAKTLNLGSIGATREASDWQRANQRFVERYPLAAGFLVPVDEEAEFDFTVWRQQIASGQRESLTAEEQIQLANQTYARSIYYAKRDELDALVEAEQISGGERRDALRQVKSQLEGAFPGWDNPNLIGIGKPTTTERMAQLEQMMRDPDIPDSEVLPSLRRYMDLRNQALDYIRAERGGSFFGSTRDRDIMDALFQFGVQTAAQDRAFAGIWQGLLSKEVD